MKKINELYESEPLTEGDMLDMILLDMASEEPPPPYDIEEELDNFYLRMHDKSEDLPFSDSTTTHEPKEQHEHSIEELYELIEIQQEEIIELGNVVRNQLDTIQVILEILVILKQKTSPELDITEQLSRLRQ